MLDLTVNPIDESQPVRMKLRVVGCFESVIYTSTSTVLVTSTPTSYMTTTTPVIGELIAIMRPYCYNHFHITLKGNIENLIVVDEVCHVAFETFTDSEPSSGTVLGYIEVDGVDGFDDGNGDIAVKSGDILEADTVVISLLSCENW